MDFRVARFVSGLFHPLLLPLATLVVLFFTDPLLRAMPGAFPIPHFSHFFHAGGIMMKGPSLCHA